MDEVILVDEMDVAQGIMEKLQAHQQGLLHRAFSIVLIDDTGRILLQQRANSKYHSPGLWTNTCCSHPQPGQSIEVSLEKKLLQEMGIKTPLHFAYKFIYKAELENGLTEHECDHVYVGNFNGTPNFNPEEVQDFKYATMEEIRNEIDSHPAQFTAWFKLIVQHKTFGEFLKNHVYPSS